MAIQAPKDFYTIKDFYNAIKGNGNGGQYIPTTHRHFQVYLHPILYDNGGLVKIGMRNNYKSTAANNNVYTEYNSNAEIETKGFFEDWFDGNTHEQFSLAIQSVVLPQQLGPSNATKPVSGSIKLVLSIA